MNKFITGILAALIALGVSEVSLAGVPKPVTQSGSVTSGHITTWAGTNLIQDGGSSSSAGNIACGGTNDTSAIQASLNANSVTTLYGATCAISATLTMPSNTTLLLNGSTLLRNAGTLTVAGDECFITNSTWSGSGNTNINVEGPGYMNCQGSTQTLSTSGSGLGALYCGVGLRWNNVANLDYGGFKISSGCFTTQQGHISGFHIHDVNIANNFSHLNQDGIHINGPASNGIVENIYEANTDFPSTDDYIALNADDALGGEMTQGNISSVQIRNINCAACIGEAVRHLANTSTESDILIDGVTGSYGGSLFTMSGFTDGGGQVTGGKFNDIAYDHVLAEFGGNPITLQATSGYGLKISHSFLQKQGGTNYYMSVGGTAFTDITIDDVVINSEFVSNGWDFIQVGYSPLVVNSIKLSNIYANSTLNAFTNALGYLVNKVGSATLNSVSINNSKVIGSTQATPTTGTIGNLTMSQVSWNGGDGTNTSVTGSSSGTAVFNENISNPLTKTVNINLSALIGTAAYTYPVAFANTPSCVASSSVACSVISASTTAVTVTGTTSTGSLQLIGN